MNQIRGHIRKFLKENADKGQEHDGKTGWFTTREITDAIMPFLASSNLRYITVTIGVLRKAGEIETVKGLPGKHPFYGMHRLCGEPAVKYCTGIVGLAPRHNDLAWRREQARIRQARKPRKRQYVKKTKEQPLNRASVPTKRYRHVPQSMVAPPPPPKPRAETFEEFLARGGKVEVLPGVNIQPKYVRCSPVDTRPERMRRGG